MNNYITLKEYVQSLNELMAANPDAGDLPLYYMMDDEGNGMNRVSYTPEVCFMLDDCHGTRTVEEEEMLDYERERDYGGVKRCVIINLHRLRNRV